jgi:hypothetical protein
LSSRTSVGEARSDVLALTRHHGQADLSAFVAVRSSSFEYGVSA